VYAHLNHVEGKCYIIDAWELGVNQIELGDHVINYLAAGSPVDELFLEANTGFHATGQYLESKLGKQNIVYYKTWGNSKHKRLAAVAPLIERGVVMMPGVRKSAITEDPRDHDIIVPDPKLNWFFDEITEFGSVTADHAVDAMTVMLSQWMEHLDTGEAEMNRAATAAKAKEVGVAVNPELFGKLQKWFGEAEEEFEETPQDKEVEWMSSSPSY